MAERPREGSAAGHRTACRPLCDVPRSVIGEDMPAEDRRGWPPVYCCGGAPR